MQDEYQKLLETFYKEILDYNTSLNENLLNSDDSIFLRIINNKRKELLLKPLFIKDIEESIKTGKYNTKPFEMSRILSNIRKDIETITSIKNREISIEYCQNFQKILKDLNIFSSKTLLNTLNKIQKVFNYKRDDIFEKEFEAQKSNLNFFQQEIEQNFSLKNKIIFGEKSQLRVLLVTLKTELQSIIALEGAKIGYENYQNEHNLIKEIEKIHIDFGTTEIKLTYNLINLQQQYNFHLEDEHIRAFLKNNELSSFHNLASYVQTINFENKELDLLKKDFAKATSKNTKKALNFYDNQTSRQSLNINQQSSMFSSMLNLIPEGISCIPTLSATQTPAKEETNHQKINYQPVNLSKQNHTRL